MNRRVRTVDVRVDGVVFPCFWSVQADMLTVWHAYFGSRTRVFSGDLQPALIEHMAIDLYKASPNNIASASVAP